MTSRRRFLSLVPIAPLIAAAGPALAAPAVDEKDPQAVALGYVPDAAKVDKAKHANYAAGQMCGSCQLYQGPAGSASGPCPLYPGKDVNAKGWCTAYVKKA